MSLQEVRYSKALEAANRFTLERGVLSIDGGASHPMRFTLFAPQR